MTNIESLLKKGTRVFKKCRDGATSGWRGAMCSPQGTHADTSREE